MTSILLDPPTQVKEAEKQDDFDRYKPATWLGRFRTWLSDSVGIDFQSQETECPIAMFINQMHDPYDVSVTGYEMNWEDNCGHHRCETRNTWAYTFVSRWDSRVCSQQTPDQRRQHAIDVANEIISNEKLETKGLT